MDDLKQHAHSVRKEGIGDDGCEDRFFERNLGDAVVPDEHVGWNVAVFFGEIFNVAETF